jgi:hypothetical protein
MLIRRAGTPASIPHLRPLLMHGDPAVKMEALSALLKFKDTGCVKVLRDLIRSDDPDVAAKAVSLAGLYRVADATGDILAKIKRVILFESDYAFNGELIKALGEIGDPRAIPDLEKLACASWSLYPQRLHGMKETLFESLGRYPKESISGLISTGERLNSDKIRRICKSLKGR